MLCGTEAIREALVDQAEAFSGRGAVAVFDPTVQGHGEIRDRMEWRMSSRKLCERWSQICGEELRVFELPL